MPIVAVINRKGGSGKSTLATHIAVYWARRGLQVMLGDIDRQQSARSWLARRPTETAFVYPWAVDRNSVLRVPSGVTHVVIDTPGGLHGFDLAKVVMYADYIVMPVSPSVFDLSSASQCYAEISSLPRVVNGKCRVAVVGMRLEPSERSEQSLSAWAEQRHIPFLGVIHRSEQYPEAVEDGKTIFDQNSSSVIQESTDWLKVMHWLDPAAAQMPVIIKDPTDSHEESPAEPPSSPSRFPNLSTRSDRASHLFNPYQATHTATDSAHGASDRPAVDSASPMATVPANATSHPESPARMRPNSPLDSHLMSRSQATQASPTQALNRAQQAKNPAPNQPRSPSGVKATPTPSSAPLTLASILAKLRSL